MVVPLSCPPDATQISSVGLIGIAMITVGVAVFVVGALGAPHPEQPEWVFKLWFVTFMALTSWGAALILRPFVQNFLSLATPWTAATSQ